MDSTNSTTNKLTLASYFASLVFPKTRLLSAGVYVGGQALTSFGYLKSERSADSFQIALNNISSQELQSEAQKNAAPSTSADLPVLLSPAGRELLQRILTD